MELQRCAYDFRLGGWIGIGLLAAAAALAVLNPAFLAKYPAADLKNGEWTAAYSKAFEDQNPVRKGAVSIFTLVNYRAFNEGRAGVLVGDNGWLFTAEELTPISAPEAVIGAKVRFIADSVRALENRKVRVVVVLVPAKLRVYPELARSYQLLPQLRPVYASTLAKLHKLGIGAPNLLADMVAQKATGDVFLRTDTHWSPLGANVVAKSVAKQIGGGQSWPKSIYQSVPNGRVEHTGDLLNYLPLGRWRDLGPQPDMVQLSKVVTIQQASSASTSLLEAAGAPVTLVGTSYSFNTKWGFEHALQRELGTSILNVSREGRGPFKPMQEYLADEQAQKSPPSVLIWEIPERYLWSTDKQVGLPE